jgi:hypothetical protein
LRPAGGGVRSPAAAQVDRLADDYTDAQIVVSSRLIGLLHERWGREGFRPFMLQGFRRLSLDSTQVLGEIFGP